MKTRYAVTFVAAVLVASGAWPTLATELASSGLEPGQSTRVGFSLGAPVRITQSLNPTTLVTNTTLFCQSGGISTDNSWWRLFDLDDDHGLIGDVCVESVDYGIEQAIGIQNIELYVGCLDDTDPQPPVGGFLDLEFVDQVGGTIQPQPEATLEFFNITGSGCCNAETQSLVVGLISEDCTETDCGSGPGSCCDRLIVGSNDLGQTETSYLAAPDCGIDLPVDLQATVCFGVDCHLVLVVNATGEVLAVAASTEVGMLVLLLAMLVAWAVMVRRFRRSADA